MQADKEIEKAKMFNTKIERTCNRRQRNNFRIMINYCMQLSVMLKENTATNLRIQRKLLPTKIL